MVNYCCVYGCGRNSRLNKHLTYFSFPKERTRQIEWLKLAGREDLLNKENKRSHRICSRHFTPSSIRNKYLSLDALPSLCLPGTSCSEDDVGNKLGRSSTPLPHDDIICNYCSNPIVGFRYKCVTCADYDLCQKCEMLEAHRIHYMLRIPKPVKFKLTDNLIKNWREFFKAGHIIPSEKSNNKCDVADNESSDDEPITKYAKNYDSGIDLTEDVKEKIRKEVTRVLKLNKNKTKKISKSERKRAGGEVTRSNKMKLEMEHDEAVNQNVASVIVPEVVFADVNDAQLDMKPEFPATVQRTASVIQGPTDQQPVMHVKLSDDLTELMVEVISNNQKTIYKYADANNKVRYQL